MANPETTQVAEVLVRDGYRYLTIFGVTVKATGTPSLWPAMKRLAEAINTAAAHRPIERQTDAE